MSGARAARPNAARSAAAYPFSGLVGQDDLRLALLANAVNPAIGGVLVRGERGTAKSTAVRAIAALLPEIDVVAGCPYACDPAAPEPSCPAGPHEPSPALARRPVALAELPVGASTDRLAGSLDLERALVDGVKAFEPGVLAAAHRGILYVDEVNLLADHLVDLLLDAAALGVNYVEREGVSVRHAARFLLVGTMNPEEGELRPQLLDRFGVSVEVRATLDPAQRAEVVRRRLAFEADADGFAQQHAAADAALAERIRAARARLGAVRLPDHALERIATACAALRVDGLRADIVTAKTALALAALDRADEVGEDHIRRAALLALAHRRRRGPLDPPGLDPEELDRALSGEEDPPPDGGGNGAGQPDDRPWRGGDRAPAGQPGGERTRAQAGEPDRSGRDSGRDDSERDHSGRDDFEPDDSAGDHSERDGRDGDGSESSRFERDGRESDRPDQTGSERASSGRPAAERLHAQTAAGRAPHLALAGAGEGARGRRSRALGAHGHPVGDRPADGSTDLAPLATLRAAAPHQRARGRTGPGLELRATDLRAHLRDGREGNLVVFVVDASGSMGARRRMALVKGAALSLLVDAYQRRDRVALIAFRGDTADVLLPSTGSVDVAAARLADLPTGGRTPLAAGIQKARELIAAERLRDPGRRALALVVTDGRANAGPDPVPAATALARDAAGMVVVDSEQGGVRLGLASELARAAGARTMSLDALAPRRAA